MISSGARRDLSEITIISSKNTEREAVFGDVQDGETNEEHGVLYQRSGLWIIFEAGHKLLKPREPSD